jgi:hypothetical protein
MEIKDHGDVLAWIGAAKRKNLRGGGSGRKKFKKYFDTETQISYFKRQASDRENVIDHQPLARGERG